MQSQQPKLQEQEFFSLGFPHSKTNDQLGSKKYAEGT
jgi:hypothetical protein